MENLEIKLKVELGISPELKRLGETLAGALLGRTPAREEAPVALPEPAPPVEATPAVPVAETPAAVEVQAAPAAVEPAAPAEVTPPTDDEMRQMMDITISRICGTTQWQESTDARVKDMRRSCTAAFKQISAHLGSDRPTALQGEQRTKFIEELDRIFVNEAQRIAEWIPF